MNDYKKTSTEKIGEFLKNNIITIVLVILCVVYILRGLISIDDNDRTWQEIIGDGLLAFFVSVTIKILMRQKGINSGFSSEKFISTANAYGKALEDNVSQYTIECEKYCLYKNKVRLREEQRKYLLKNGLDYKKFESGEYDIQFSSITNRKERKSKQKILKKCRNLKIYEYTTVMITNAYDNNDIEDKILSQTAKRYKTKSAATNFSIGILCMFLFGYYGITKGAFDIYNIIWCSVQIALYLVLGVIEQINAYEFVSETLRGKIKRIISIIDDFTNVRTQKPSLLNIFEEEENDGKEEKQQ